MVREVTRKTGFNPYRWGRGYKRKIMFELQRYKNARTMPPDEVPAGIRWYTEEEVNAVRCWYANARMTTRQYDVARAVLEEIKEENKRKNLARAVKEEPSVVDNSRHTYIYVGGEGIQAAVLVVVLALFVGWGMQMFADAVEGLWFWIDENAPFSYGAIVVGGVVVSSVIGWWVKRVEEDHIDKDNWKV